VFGETKVTEPITLNPSWEPVEEPTPEEPDLSTIVFSRNLSLYDGFDINLRVRNIPDGVDLADITVTVTAEGADPVVTKLSDAVAEYRDGEFYAYKVVLGKFASGQLTDMIHVTVDYKGDTVLRDFDYSVKMYCDQLIAGDDAKFVAVGKAALDYGTYAQKVYGYNTDNLANGGTDFNNIQAVEIPAAKPLKEGAVKGISGVSANLALESSVTLNIKVKHTADADMSKYTFLLDGTKVTPVDDGEIYLIAITNIPYGELNTNHTVTVLGEDDAEFSFTISPLGYMYAARNDAKFGDLYKALYLYYDTAVKAYAVQ
jgi:hypothetical protein